MPDDRIQFKRENQHAWESNCDYWLSNPLRQVEDTKVFFKSKLREVLKPGMKVFDMGCGSGWLLDFLLELEVPFSYVGLDFSPQFVAHLKSKYSNLPEVSFELFDFEEALPLHLQGKADIVFNCFNFFEILDLDAAFENAARMLKPHGQLVVFTIDPTYLALAVSKSMPEFRERLRLYEEMKSRGETPHFFQNIDLGDGESRELKYASVLYSLDDFFKKARKNSLRLIDYGEVVKTSKFLPKIYQYIVFSK
jgi:SAM-dependent methyltransferase